MQFRWFVLFCIIFNLTFAVSTSEINDDLNNLVNKINKINNDLDNERQNQVNLNQVIKDSNLAIKQSNKVLTGLYKKREIDLNQLNQIESSISQVKLATNSAENSVQVAINHIYQQLRKLQNTDNQSIFNGNSSLSVNRKKAYLIAILKTENQNYQLLAAKLNQLNKINTNIINELLQLDQKLSTNERHRLKLLATQRAKAIEVDKLKNQIATNQKHLDNLKTRYNELNKLLNKLTTNQNNNDNAKLRSVNVANIDNSFEDKTSFLYRKLNRPVDGVVKSGFGEMNNGIPSKGVLFSSNNKNVYSISDGKVLYVGELPGFGQMIVIDHGNNYVSIYAGVIPKVNKSQLVTVGQIIANSGSNANQPMHGVYFELRHFGKPVNPAKLS